jgi:hypothetical protein
MFVPVLPYRKNLFCLYRAVLGRDLSRVQIIISVFENVLGAPVSGRSGELAGRSALRAPQDRTPKLQRQAGARTVGIQWFSCHNLDFCKRIYAFFAYLNIESLNDGNR